MNYIAADDERKTNHGAIFRVVSIRIIHKAEVVNSNSRFRFMVPNQGVTVLQDSRKLLRGLHCTMQTTTLNP
jgi:hypothetical protein